MPPTILKSFLIRDEGGIAIVVAAGLAMLLGAAAVAVDMSYLYVERNRLQVAADAAALAGANKLPDEVEARLAAKEFAERNMPDEAHGTVLVDQDIEVGVWDKATRNFTVGATPANAVRVATRRGGGNGNPVSLFFGKVLGVSTLDLSASAIAGGSRRPICLIALDSSAQGSLSLTDNAEINANGCDIYVNSTDDHALDADGNADVTADTVCVTGGYSQIGGSSIAPLPTTGCPPALDPLAQLKAPSFSGCDHTGASYSDDDGVTLNPGVYCGGLNIHDEANVTFNPGIYVIKGGNFTVSGSARATGEDVGFYLTDGALLDFSTTGTIALKGPQGGEMAGILFFQDRNDSGSHNLNSGSANVLEGTIYLPNGVITSTSSSLMGGGSYFTMYIALRFELSAGAGFEINSDYESSSVPLPSRLDTVGFALLD